MEINIKFPSGRWEVSELGTKIAGDWELFYDFETSSWSPCLNDSYSQITIRSLSREREEEMLRAVARRLSRATMIPQIGESNHLRAIQAIGNHEYALAIEYLLAVCAAQDMETRIISV